MKSEVGSGPEALMEQVAEGVVRRNHEEEAELGRSAALFEPPSNKPLQQPVAPVTPLAGQASRQAAAFAADAPAADWQR